MNTLKNSKCDYTKNLNWERKPIKTKKKQPYEKKKKNSKEEPK